MATSPSARSCKVLLQLQGDVWFSLSPTVLKKHNECDTLTPKSLKILSDSWLPNSLGSYCSWLPAVRSTAATEKFLYVGMSNYSFFCCNSSLDLKFVHVINHGHFTALIRTGLKSFTVFCYQRSFRL